MTDSFQRGEGRWQGASEVYDSQGRYAGQGRDARVVRRDLGSGSVEVNVSFEGPFSLSGTYRISDRGDHRRYEGPLNYGYAEALGEELIDANNYWPDLGLSQRFWLMVMPDGKTQLSLALLSRGEQTAYTVVGEYHRSPAEGGEIDKGGKGDEGGEMGKGGEIDERHKGGKRGEQDEGHAQDQAEESPHANAEESLNSKPDADPALLLRPGTWSGTLKLLDAHLSTAGQTNYSEHIARDECDRLIVSLQNSGFASEAEIVLSSDEQGLRGAPGSVTGSASIWGGRALAGQFLFGKEGLRLWRREVATRCGDLKGVLHTWYQGGSRIGAAYGALKFTPSSDPRP